MMNRSEPSHHYQQQMRIYALVLFTVLTAFGSAGNGSAQQWTTNGNDISNTNSGNVGVGTPAPYNRFHATAVQYNAGTASQSGTTVTGVGTSWNSQMIASLLVFSNGTKRTITGIGGPTTLTVLEPGAVASQGYTIYHGGLNVSATGNVGVGIANFRPWLQDFKVLQLGGNSALTSHKMAVEGSSIMMTQNGYIEDGVNWRYIADATASRYYQINGTHGWQVAPTGTAGSVVNWKTGLAIDNSGRVGIGTSSPAVPLTLVGSADTSFSGVPFNASFASSNPAAAGVGAGVVLGGSYTGTTPTTFSVISGVKENATDGNHAGALLFATRVHGGSATEKMRITSTGNVGIGTTTPTTKLHVVGDLTVTGNIAAKYQDIAEWIPASQKLMPGTVVVLDAERGSEVVASTQAYDTKVAGVISAKPGLALGEAGEDKVLVATTGRVRVKVDATRAPIRVGDLLVTGDKEGVAMRSEPLDLGGVPIHRSGTLLGKALESLERGTGEILVLLSLQ